MKFTSFSKLRRPLSQICAVMVKNVLMLTYGMAAGVVTIMIPYLSDRSHSQDIYLDQEGISWIGSIGTMCVPLGCIVAGALVNYLGRRKSMQIACIPFLICCIGLKYSATRWQIYLALGTNGFAGGFLEAPVLTYVAEITEPSLRGTLSATSNVAYYLGIFIEFALGTFLGWRDVALVTTIAPIVCFILLCIIPESPHWLIIKGRYDEAKKSLAWLRGWTKVSEIELEYQEILTKQITSNEDKFTYKTVYQYTQRSFIIPLVMLCFMFFTSQFTGTTAIQTFAVNIFSTLKTPIDKFQATLLLGAAELFGIFPCIILIHYVGKRAMLFYSLAVGSLCLIVVATFAHIANIQYFDQNTVSASTIDIASYKWLPLSFIIIAVFAFQGGVRVVPWILVGELFSRTTSPMGSGIASAINYMFSFAASKMFLSIVSLITLSGTFWLYGAVGICSLTILFFWLPETEGKPLQEITDHFSGVAKLDKRVRRIRSGDKNTNA